MFHPKSLIIINIRIIYTKDIQIKINHKFSIEKRPLLTCNCHIRYF